MNCKWYTTRVKTLDSIHLVAVLSDLIADNAGQGESNGKIWNR